MCFELAGSKQSSRNENYTQLSLHSAVGVCQLTTNRALPALHCRQAGQRNDSGWAIFYLRCDKLTCLHNCDKASAAQKYAKIFTAKVRRKNVRNVYFFRCCYLTIKRFPQLTAAHGKQNHLYYVNENTTRI